MRINVRVPILVLLTAALLSGCMAQSRVQAKYMSREDDCRSEAQLRALDRQATGVTGATADSPAQTSYSIAAAFSECMQKEGWKVTTPKPPTAPPAPTNTAVVTLPPSGAPGPGGTVAASRPPETANATTPAAPILGPGVQPQPAPAFTPGAAPMRTMPGIPSTATYAPAQSAPAPMQGSYDSPARYVPSYGQGGGRQF